MGPKTAAKNEKLFQTSFFTGGELSKDQHPPVTFQDPYNGLLKSLYKWVAIIYNILYHRYLSNQGFDPVVPNSSLV